VHDHGPACAERDGKRVGSLSDTTAAQNLAGMSMTDARHGISNHQR
jgi:hypothetical protein